MDAAPIRNNSESTPKQAPNLLIFDVPHRLPRRPMMLAVPRPPRPEGGNSAPP